MGYKEIPFNEIKLGMFVRLPLTWWKHPFIHNAFKVKNSKELKILMELGLNTIEYDPEKSSQEEKSSEDHLPSGKMPAPSSANLSQKKLDPTVDVQIANKKRQIQFLMQRRKNLLKSEQDYHLAFSQVSKIMNVIETDQEVGMTSARALLNNVVDTMLDDEETVVHLINLKEKDSMTFFHSLNVCILSLILGRKLGLSKTELNELGMGALFHDMGKQKIPKKILFKKTPLTNAEKKFLQLHPKYGVSMLAGNPHVSPRVLEIVYQHHEKCNGKGYPQGLKENHISYFTKITAVADVYDNITNQCLHSPPFTPHEALSFIYTKLHEELSQEIISTFIKSVGVYPPGTIVELSDGSLGMVITTDRIQCMKPMIILYNENVPREEPMIINLAEEETNIVRCLHPLEVPPEVVTYLQQGKMVGFFMGSLSSPKKAPRRLS